MRVTDSCCTRVIETRAKRLHRSEVWGGIECTETDLLTGPLAASLFSMPAHGFYGGDIYYVTAGNLDRVTRICVADVGGQREPVISMSHRIYESLWKGIDEPDNRQILLDLNSRAIEQGPMAMTTALVMSFNAQTRALKWASAGHPPLWIRKRSIGGWHPLETGSSDGLLNLPLGIFPDTGYQQDESTLQSGDQLFLYTDGATDAPSLEGQPFGGKRLRAALDEAGGASVAEIKSAVLAALRKHTGGRLSHDGVTLMALEIL